MFKIAVMDPIKSTESIHTSLSPEREKGLELAQKLLTSDFFSLRNRVGRRLYCTVAHKSGFMAKITRAVAWTLLSKKEKSTVSILLGKNDYAYKGLAADIPRYLGKATVTIGEKTWPAPVSLEQFFEILEALGHPKPTDVQEFLKTKPSDERTLHFLSCFSQRFVMEASQPLMLKAKDLGVKCRPTIDSLKIEVQGEKISLQLTIGVEVTDEKMPLNEKNQFTAFGSLQGVIAYEIEGSALVQPGESEWKRGS